MLYACGTDERHHGFADLVAVKSVKIKRGDRKKKLDEVREEVKNLQGLSHVHVIALLGSFVHCGRFGIVMFPVAQYHLGNYMRKIYELLYREDLVSASLMMGRLRGFFSCLCSALLYLHTLERKIKHRDIKPENILVDQHGNVLLTDFGISKRYDSTEEATTDGPSKGRTVKYAAPEVMQGGPRGLDIDVFSLGCVFLEMATVLSDLEIRALYNWIGKDDIEETVLQPVSYYDAIDMIP
ncbi:hypothetical protein LTR08_004070 [Meristemomyces frigidus]|nr:hypothetical protein LTR08_004070 [Meristemomyces frigidus]